jgi:periplasmic copper chaperone A
LRRIQFSRRRFRNRMDLTAPEAVLSLPLSRLSMKTSILFACMLSLAAVAATAQEFKAGPLEIDHPWSRATPKGAKVGVGFLTIKNTGTAPDRLVSGTSAAAGKLEIHEMSMDNGVMKMRPVPAGIEIKPGETVELKPGSFHIMMMDLKEPIERGKPLKALLTFEKAGPVEVEFTVVAPGASPAAAAPAGMPGMPGMPGMKH